MFWSGAARATTTTPARWLWSPLVDVVARPAATRSRPVATSAFSRRLSSSPFCAVRAGGLEPPSWTMTTTDDDFRQSRTDTSSRGSSTGYHGFATLTSGPGTVAIRVATTVTITTPAIAATHYVGLLSTVVPWLVACTMDVPPGWCAPDRTPTAGPPAATVLDENHPPNDSLWFIKRTFQPSLIRKKRKTGFLVRQRTVGGRRTLARRRRKQRWRLGGGI